MRLSNNFILQELVHPSVYETWGDSSVDFLNKHMVEMLQLLRNETGSRLVVNDWHIDGPYQDSGLRLPNGVVGSMMSKHKFGCACDVKPIELTTDDLLDEIEAHPAKYYGITRIENIEYTRTSRGVHGKDWIHIEFGDRSGDIKVFIP